MIKNMISELDKIAAANQGCEKIHLTVSYSEIINMIIALRVRDGMESLKNHKPHIHRNEDMEWCVEALVPNGNEDGDTVVHSFSEQNLDSVIISAVEAIERGKSLDNFIYRRSSRRMI